jgi:hypothetical protein
MEINMVDITLKVKTSIDGLSYTCNECGHYESQGDTSGDPVSIAEIFGIECSRCYSNNVSINAYLKTTVE